MLTILYELPCVTAIDTKSVGQVAGCVSGRLALW